MTMMDLEEFTAPPPEGDEPGIDPGEGFAEAIAEFAAAHFPRPALILGSTLEKTVAAIVSGVERHNEPQWLYRRDGLMAILVERDARKTIDLAERIALRARLTRHFAVGVCRRDKATGAPQVKETDIPLPCVDFLLTLDDLTLPPLDEVRTMPCYAPGGRMVMTSGYDATSRAYFDLRHHGEVLVDATDEALADAKRLIFDELLVDFPFADQASRAHAVALGLLPLVRLLIDGQTPLHLISGTSEGAGKTVLARSLLSISAGATPCLMTLSRTEEEFEKKLFAALLDPPAGVVIDNVARKLDSAALALILTSPTYTNRILAVSKNARVLPRCAWVATGNNIPLSREMARRSVRIHLQPRHEKPWERTSFRHKPLEEWVRANGPILFGAFAVLARRWVDAGMPSGTKTLGSYEPWARVIGGILDVAGIPGFLEGREAFEEAADDESARWTGFVEAWWAAHREQPQTVKDLHQLAYDAEVSAYPPGHPKEQDARKSLGNGLRTRRGRVIAGKVLDHGGRDRTGGTRWVLSVQPDSADVQHETQQTETRTTTDSDAGLLSLLSLVPTPHTCVHAHACDHAHGLEIDSADSADSADVTNTPSETAESRAESLLSQGRDSADEPGGRL